MENISVANLPRLMKFKKPWDVVKAYPEMAWKVLKTLHDENMELREEVEDLKDKINNILEESNVNNLPSL